MSNTTVEITFEKRGGASRGTKGLEEFSLNQDLTKLSNIIT